MRYIAVLLLLILPGCGPGVSDYSEDMGGGKYSFSRTDSKSHWLFPTKKCGINCPSIHRDIVKIRENENVIAVRRQVIEEYSCDEGYISNQYIDLFEQYVIRLHGNQLIGPMSVPEYQTFLEKNTTLLTGIELIDESNNFNGSGQVLKGMAQCTNPKKI